MTIVKDKMIVLNNAPAEILDFLKMMRNAAAEREDIDKREKEGLLSYLDDAITMVHVVVSSMAELHSEQQKPATERVTKKVVS